MLFRSQSLQEHLRAKDIIIDQLKSQVGQLKVELKNESEKAIANSKEIEKLRKESLLDSVNSAKLIHSHGHERNRIKDVIHRLEAATHEEVHIEMFFTII